MAKIKLVIYLTIGIAVMSVFLWFFRTGKALERAKGERKIAEYQLEICEKTVKVSQKQFDEQQRQHLDLLKDFDDLKELYEETTAIRDTLDKRYSRLYRLYYGRNFDVRKLKIERVKK